MSQGGKGDRGKKSGKGGRIGVEEEISARRCLRMLIDRYPQVRNDFGKRYRQTLVHGRPSTPVEVLLRMLLLKHLFGWSYQETEDRVDESPVLRWFSRLFWA